MRFIKLISLCVLLILLLLVGCQPQITKPDYVNADLWDEINLMYKNVKNQIKNIKPTAEKDSDTGIIQLKSNLSLDEKLFNPERLLQLVEEYKNGNISKDELELYSSVSYFKQWELMNNEFILMYNKINLEILNAKLKGEVYYNQKELDEVSKIFQKRRTEIFEAFEQSNQGFAEILDIKPLKIDKEGFFELLDEVEEHNALILERDNVYNPDN